MRCKKCKERVVKNGTTKTSKQRYYCRSCKLTFQSEYVYKACRSYVNKQLVTLLKEGCGTLSISRILEISPTTTTKRILTISDQIKLPILFMNKEYEVDELCTYVGSKSRKRWVAYALEKESKKVVSLALGTRTKKTLEQMMKGLLLSEPRKIFTDKLNIYKSLIPETIHKTKQYSINHIERMNLTLRTHLKRLSRRTICYSKSILMLMACLKIYFWG